MAYFKVKDLMINVADERLERMRPGRGAALCSAEQPTHLTCTIHSPVMQVVRMSDRVKLVVDQAYRDPANAEILEDFADRAGRAVVAGAVQGGAGMPNPECGGTSLETIPTPITPVVHDVGFLTVADLPVIKRRLQETMKVIEKLEAQHAPQAGEVDVLVEHLEAAVKSLKRG